jgi:hypothetical protein
MASCVRKRAAFVAVSPVGGLASSACKWTCTRPYKPIYVRRSSPIFGILSNPRVVAPVVRCVASSPANNDEEDVLDENAMRAAEIHEVLTGLEEFRARIVDGTMIATWRVHASPVLRFRDVAGKCFIAPFQVGAR